jgi:hypothetical protein
MASAAWRWASRSRLSRVRQPPSGPWVRLTMTRWVWGSGSPARLTRWVNPTATSPELATCSAPSRPVRVPTWLSR